MALVTSQTYPLHFLPASNPPYKLLETHPALSLLPKCRSIENIKQVHSHFIKFGLHNTHFGLSKLVEFCAVSPCGDLPYALLIFDAIDNPNHVIYNMIIRGFSLSPSPELALEFYVKMVFEGVVPNHFTFPFVLKCCGRVMVGRSTGKQIHGHVLKFGLHDDVYVHTSVIHMYAQNGELDDARLVFDKSGFRDAVSFRVCLDKKNEGEGKEGKWG